MASRDDEVMHWDKLSVGATRPAMQKGLNVPFWFLIPILIVPAIVVAITRNPFWLVLILALTLLGRWIVATDHNRPRVLWLSLISGAMFADRQRWGGDSADPLGEVRHGR